MNYLYTLSILAFCLLLALIFNFYSHWTHREQEQTKLDAVALSLCHQHKNFLLDDFQSWNQSITVLQSLMSKVGSLCWVPGTQAECLNLLANLGYLGQSFEISQATRIWTYQSKRKIRAHRLRAANTLERKFFKLKEQSLLQNFLDASSLSEPGGFQRAKLQGWNKTMQKIYQNKARWPRILEPNANFKETHRYQLEYRPDRELILAKNAKEQGFGIHSQFSPQIKKAQKTAKTRSFSGCQIEPLQGDFRVRRLSR